jgi:predicted metal-binding membrane protein
LHQLLDRAGWLATHAWLIGAATLLVAGAYQFTALKYRCLDKCRSPMTFIAGHWSGRAPRRQALRLGGAHGIYCVGCCWSLMLLMFAVGVGNVAWMLALGAAMAIEKNMPWGRQISTPLGITLLGLGALTAAFAVA